VPDPLDQVGLAIFTQHHYGLTSLSDVDDFCLWGPANPLSTIGDVERDVVAWCTRSGRGTRTMPDDTLRGVHFVKTGDYVQVTGVGDFTKINILPGDE
jgi:hypothetical protein